MTKLSEIIQYLRNFCFHGGRVESVHIKEEIDEKEAPTGKRTLIITLYKKP